MMSFTFQDLFRDAASTIKREHIVAFISACAILTVGLFISARVSKAVGRIARLDAPQRLLFRKIAYYALVTVTFASAASQLGFDLKVLLGAAGVLSVAIGFAAQTSASNLISGLFLMIERPFTIGQSIQIGDISGEVAAIEMLSCRIRTFDNRMVRVPNETMVKSNIYNLSHFPIRRIDLNVAVGYESSIAQTRAALGRAADQNPLVLDEPKPLFIFQGFGESSLNVQFQTWTLAGNMTEAQNSLFESAKAELEAAGIEIACPRRVLEIPG